MQSRIFKRRGRTKQLQAKLPAGFTGKLLWGVGNKATGGQRHKGPSEEKLSENRVHGQKVNNFA